MRALGTTTETLCWHCNRPIDDGNSVPAARYLYRGDQPATAVVEDWIECSCGAFQNVRRLNEITIEPLGRPR